MRTLDLILMASIAALLVVVATVPALAMEKGTAIALGLGAFGLALISASVIGLAFKLADEIVRARVSRRERRASRPASVSYNSAR